MKFMFVICEGVEDAANFFHDVILPDFYQEKTTISLDDAKKVYREWGPTNRITRNQSAAIELAVSRWNEGTDTAKAQSPERSAK